MEWTWASLTSPPTVTEKTSAAIKSTKPEKDTPNFAPISKRIGTKSAKRHLKKLSGKERRFHRDVNHCVSGRLVAKAKGTGRAIALEDLKGIRNQTTVRRAQRSRHHTWTFRQLRSFIEYKAALSGVPVILVDPRGTSHICPECGHNEKGNRVSRNEFRCVRCGFAGPADHVAAINIAARAAVNQPMVACGDVEALYRN